MSAASCLLSEDQFLCPICLDVFSDPVSIPCGHNFCKPCISQHWQSDAACVCPVCKDVFYRRPSLKVNVLISEMTSKFVESCKVASSSGSEELVAKPGEVQCDICTGTKLKAVRTCLRCEASYCDDHLQPHVTAACLKQHQLIYPVDNLEDRTCKKHQESLRFYCKTEEMCLCSLCLLFGHTNHLIVSLALQVEGEKEKAKAETQQMIRQRQQKIGEIKASVNLSRAGAEREKDDGIQVCSALKQLVERSQEDFIKEVEEKQRGAEKQAEDLIQALQGEISEMKARAAKMEKLWNCEDHLHLLRKLQSISAPPSKDWTRVKVQQGSNPGSLVRAAARLEAAISSEVKNLQKVELRRIQQFAVDVTFDPDTAHPALILAEDHTRVRCGDGWQQLPQNPQRFKRGIFVLGLQSFSSGRSYFEVQVKGKTNWIVGVASESIDRNGEVYPSSQKEFWTVGLRNADKFYAFVESPVPLELRWPPEKVGVFVDVSQGLVSFYHVDAAALIFSFTDCCFADKLLPVFSPGLGYGGTNSAPLVITAVDY